MHTEVLQEKLFFISVAHIFITSISFLCLEIDNLEDLTISAVITEYSLTFGFTFVTNYFLLILFAQVSFKVTVLLNTSLSLVEYFESTQK